MVFLFVAGFIDLANELVEQPPVTRWHTMYSHLVSFRMGFKSGKIKDDVWLRVLRRHIMELKRLPKAKEDGNCETGVYKPKFHLLNQVFDYQRGLNAWKRWIPCHLSFNTHVKRTYKTISQGQSLDVVETICVRDTRR